MAKPRHIELEDGTVIPILYEDRSVLAIDKPAGWMLAPDSWDRTGRNLHLALQSSIEAGDYWARSRSLKFLRFVHRLDAGTSGVLLMARSRGALQVFSELFETRRVEKAYLAVIRGQPRQASWTCDLPLGADPRATGLMRVDRRAGKDAQTHFRVLQTGPARSLLEARPVTGRTHQIRVHLAEAGHPVLGDSFYGGEQVKARGGQAPLALRAIRLAYRDPFQKRAVIIEAPHAEFVQAHGFEPPRRDTFGFANREVRDKTLPI